MNEQVFKDFYEDMYARITLSLEDQISRQVSRNLDRHLQGNFVWPLRAQLLNDIDRQLR